jgi:hypothetical protein
LNLISSIITHNKNTSKIINIKKKYNTIKGIEKMKFERKLK